MSKLDMRLETLEETRKAEEEKAAQEARRKEFMTCKPSRMLEMALEDVIELSKKPGYRINMRTWVSECDGECAVCLGGAALVNSYGYQQRKNSGYSPENEQNTELANRIYALNAFRCGNVQSALVHLGYRPIAQLWYNLLCPDRTTLGEWSTDEDCQKVFIEEQRQLISDLRWAGL